MYLKFFSSKLILSASLTFMLATYGNSQDSVAVHPLVTGHTHVEHIENNTEHNWFSRNYQEYKTDTSTYESFKKVSPEYHIVVIGGTWCPDTHRELPKFYKIIDDAGFPRDKVKLYFVDHDFKSPEMTGKKYKVKHVPTFIVFKGEKEKGRIVEKPQHSIEKDLLQYMK